jgi:hypothetical protein
MPAPPGSFSDFIYQHPVLVSSSAIGTITMVRKVIMKGLPALRQILRAFMAFLLGVETDWRDYQEARPRKDQVRMRPPQSGAEVVK